MYAESHNYRELNIQNLSVDFFVKNNININQMIEIIYKEDIMIHNNDTEKLN